MGAQVGVEYALGGHDVRLVSRSPEGVRSRVGAALGALAAYGLATTAEIEAARVRIAAGSDALAGQAADIVFESVPESFDLKADLVRPLAAAWPRAIVASNTSSLSIAELGRAIGAEERTVGTHYWNPPLLMPLVELVVGAADRTIVERVERTLRALGKRPVLVEHEVPGFVWNRLQLALVREALWIVEHGVASPEAVDEIVRDGLARRWRLTGPFETAALGGVETFVKVAANLWPRLSDAVTGEGLYRYTPATGLEGVRERRDAALARELLDDRKEGR